jgi:hypothetical protein
MVVNRKFYKQINIIYNMDEFKQIGFKADVELDRVITLRASETNTDKSKFYRKIIDDYFDKFPMTDSEKEFLKLNN